MLSNLRNRFNAQSDAGTEEPPASSSDQGDGYLDYGQSSSNRIRRKPVPSDESAPSERTTSTAPLNRGGPTGVATGSSPNGFSDPDRRSFVSGSSDEKSSSLDAAYAAGMPIGLLAALGTPYAKKPLYRSKKCKVLCLAVVPLFLVVTVIITLFPVLKAIATHALHTSVVHVYMSNITYPTDTGFNVTLEGQVKKTGIFPAHIYFERPVYVYWVNPDNMQELELGNLNFAPLGAAAGHAKVKQETYFNIANETAFGRFSEYLITQTSFTWQLRSDKVQAKAFAFIATNNLVFRKDVVINGFANMTDVSITDFQLPGNDPAGGITTAVTTQLTNPSPFGVELGVLSVDLYYMGLYLGPAMTFGPINITSGVNHISLGGHLLDYSNNPEALALLSVLFSNYLNGIPSPVQAVGRNVVLPDGSSPAWLVQGIQALVLQVPLVSPTGKISPIKSITIETFNIVYTADTPYNPTASSPLIRAGIGLPFGFTLNISNVANTFNIIQNNTLIAGLDGVYGGSVTNIQTMNAGYTTAELALIVPPAPLIVANTYDAHLTLEQFQTDFALENGANFFLNGTTNAVTDTPIGQVSLTDVGFTVPAGLVGLSGLLLFPTLVLSVDVIGGTTDYVELAIEVGLTNPSNLNLSVSDVNFMLFATDGSYLGRTILPDLHLTLGYQTHSSIGQFLANDSPTALRYLNDFAAGRANDLMIAGFNGSSPVESLNEAFSYVRLNSTLNGLGIKLINNAALEVLPTTGITNDVATTVVSLNNPFSAPLVITNIQSNVTSRGIFLGRITVDTNFNATGKQANESPDLEFVLNLFPPDVFSLLRELVIETGQNPDYLDGIVQLGNYQYVPTTGPGTKRMKRSLVRDEDAHLFTFEEDHAAYDFGHADYADMLLSPMRHAAPGEAIRPQVTPIPRSSLYADLEERTALPEKRSPHLAKRNLYTGFDLVPYVDAAFKALTVNVELVSTVHIDDFVTDLSYSQTNVPTITDSTLNLLLPVLATPIVQNIVDGSVLAVNTVLITNPQLNSFGTTLTGSITNAGPFDAIISFPQGLTVSWNASPLGQIAMPDVSLTGDQGAMLNLNAGFTVADVGHLTDFTGYLLNEESFTWQIYGANLAIDALGINVPGISISKQVVLSGMNGFKNDVVINSFDLPYNDPAGGIHLTIATSLTNPASVGVELSALSFMNTYGSTTIGPAAAESAFTLEPKSTISLPLAGRLVPQSGQGLIDVSTLFNGFIHGVPASLVVHGQDAGPAGVTWLDDGIKALNIPVVLPAAASLQIINSITINQVTLNFSPSTAYAPLFSTSNTVAAFQLPFAFPLAITALASQITSQYPSGNGIALLQVPQIPTTTDVVARTTVLQFQNVPFAVFGDQHSQFSQFLTTTTDSQSITFGLGGTADSVASTAVGDLNVNGIAFQVDTSLLGLQGLNAQQAFVTDLDVYHGYPSYLQINVNAHLYNPSNITLQVQGDTAFTLSFMNELIGRAIITNLQLVPGANVVPTQVRYEPAAGAPQQAGQVLLQNFVQAIPSTTIISADGQTTPIDSLTQALESLSLSTVIPPLMQNLVTQAQLTFPLDIVQTGIAESVATIANPFTASININGLIASAYYQGLFLGQINQPNLNPAISAPGHTTINTPTLPLNFNLDPRVIIQLLELRGQATGTDLGPLPTQFAYVLGLSDAQLANVTGNQNTSVDLAAMPVNPACNSGRQFDVFDAILNSLKGLAVTLVIESTDHLDDYGTPLNFNQSNVPAITDRTSLYLIGAVGKPIVQHLVDLSTLSFSAGNITQVTDQGFAAALSGTLGNTGPFDAQIITPQPGITVTWEGQDIATIILEDICAAADISVPDLEKNSQLTITNYNAFVQFATYILHNPSFTWVVHTNRIQVIALGTLFDNVKIAKVISFLAFNNLPGVTIANFDLPSDHPPDGINISTDSMIPSPSNLGIELGTANFISSFENNEVGPIAAMNLFLARETTTTTHLTGYIVHQSGDGIQTTGVLFSKFLQGINQTLQVTGQSVISPAQPNSPVTWLSAAFQTLTIDVILPGKIYKIIQSITVDDFELVLQNQNQNYHIDTSNKETDTMFKNPFGFSLSVAQVATDILITFPVGGASTATLTTPLAAPLLSGTSTGQNAPLNINFSNRSLDVYQDAYTSYQNFLAQVTDTTPAVFGFGGSANVTANLLIGLIPISGIPIFDITSTFSPAINSFRGGPFTGVQIPQTPVTVGSGTVGTRFQIQAGAPSGADFIRINIPQLNLYNPAQITLATNDIALPIYFPGVAVPSFFGESTSGTEFVGRQILSPLNLIPGTNQLSGQFQYAPNRPLDGNVQNFVTQYLYGNQAIPLIAALSPNGAAAPGDNQQPSDYTCLVPALNGVAPLAGTFPGLQTALVNKIEIFVSVAEALCHGTASITIQLNNNLQATVTLLRVINRTYQPASGQSLNVRTTNPDAALQYASFDHTFTTPYVTAGNTLNPQFSEPILVNLTKGFSGSTPLLSGQNGASGLYIVNQIDNRVGDNGGTNGYDLTSLIYNQNDVPYTINLFLTGDSQTIAAADPSGANGGSLNPTALAASLLSSPASGLATLMDLLDGGCSGESLGSICNLTAGLLTALGISPTQLTPLTDLCNTIANCFSPTALQSALASGDLTAAVGTLVTALENGGTCLNGVFTPGSSTNLTALCTTIAGLTGISGLLPSGINCNLVSSAQSLSTCLPNIPTTGTNVPTAATLASLACVTDGTANIVVPVAATTLSAFCTTLTSIVGTSGLPTPYGGTGTGNGLCSIACIANVVLPAGAAAATALTSVESLLTEGFGCSGSSLVPANAAATAALASVCSAAAALPAGLISVIPCSLTAAASATPAPPASVVESVVESVVASPVESVVASVVAVPVPAVSLKRRERPTPTLARPTASYAGPVREWQDQMDFNIQHVRDL